MTTQNRRLSVGLFLLLAGCGGGSTAPSPTVATVSVSPSQASIEIAETVQLSATARDASSNLLSGRSIGWSSSNSAVATVTTDGLVTGVSEGSATIQATSEGRSGSASITVTPLPVETVEVAPDPAQLIAGTAIQMTATLRDRNGAELTDRAVTWSTESPFVATVSGSGLLSGVAEGITTVTATSEGVSGSADVDVAPQPPVAVDAVLPDPLVEGEPASLTGSGFSPTPAANTVTVDGLEAMVTSATATTLDFIVPLSVCRPTRPVKVQVAVGVEASEVVEVTVRPAEFLNMVVGEQILLDGGSDLCLQFDEAVGAERYLLAVQSVSEAPSTLTGVLFSSSTNPAGQVRPPLSTVPAAGIPARGFASDSDLDRERRWAAHRRAEIDFMERERALLAPITWAPPSGSAVGAPSKIPADTPVGTELMLRFPGFDTNSCQDFIDITVIVRRVSDRGIFVEDVNNPAGGFTAADWDDMADDFDSTIYDSDVDHFGAPSDFDANERIVVVVTKEVNELQTSSPLAFVAGSNLFTVESCPASNEGEYYWSRAPDSAGLFNAGEYALEDARLDVRTLLAHEFTHIIQGSRRLMGGGTPMVSYMSEGGATAAEQFSAFRFEGRTSGQNYDNSAIYSAFGADPHFYYGFLGDLLAYFGFDFDETHYVGAPEQCTWVGNISTSPCDFSNRVRYGGTYSVVQHAIDRYGAALGGPEAVHQAIVDFTGGTGFTVIEGVFGVPIEEILASWVLMLYVDDRFTGSEFQDLQFLNFDLRSLEDAWQTSAARLTPYAVGFGEAEQEVTVRGGSFGLFDLSGAGRAGTAVGFFDQNGDPLPSFFQVSVLRLE